MIRRCPVITGTGIICAAGCGLTPVWESIRANRSGLGPLTLFSSPRLGHHLVGQVREDVAALAGHARGSRSDQLAWIAAREALAAAGLEAGLGNLAPDRVGVMFGGTVGGMLGTEQFLAALLREHKHRFGPLRFHECAGAADGCARSLGAQGPVATLSTACSSGAMAILAAAELIEQDAADVMLAGAADSLARLTLNGFGSLLLLDPNGCRPFDARRAGISLGEGAAMLVLEAESTARARGATILARLAGWGASCDAFHATAPEPAGRGALASMQQALTRGELQPGAIDFVSVHGTATPDNDPMEAAALKSLFGRKVPPFSSVKRFFGHTLAASGAIQAVLAVQSLREQAVPGTPGFEIADEKIGLEPVKVFRPQALSRILSNSFGFGGNNVTLILARADVPCPAHSIPDVAAFHEPPDPFRQGHAVSRLGSRRSNLVHGPWAGPEDKGTPHEPERRTPPRLVGETIDQRAGAVPGAPEAGARVQLPSARRGFAILGTGVVSPAGHSLAEIATTFNRGGAPTSRWEVPALSPIQQAQVYACGEFGAPQFLEPAKRRKLSRLQQMAVVAARQALSPEFGSATTPEKICVAIGTGLGALGDTAAFVENLILKDERAPRAALFANSVHNSLASQVAIELHCAGLNSTPVHREIAFETALWQGITELAAGRADLALAGAADELNQYHLAAGLRWGWWQSSSLPLRPFGAPLRPPAQPLPGEGCALFALGRAEQASSPLAFVSALRLGRRGRPDAEAEADWILQTLARDGVAADQVDLLLTGANGLGQGDEFYQAVAAAFSRAAGRVVPCAAYKHGCGEHHSASAFGFLTAIGLVRGDIATERPVHTVVLYTLASTGAKGMCCVRQ